MCDWLLLRHLTSSLKHYVYLDIFVAQRPENIAEQVLPINRDLCHYLLLTSVRGLFSIKTTAFTSCKSCRLYYSYGWVTACELNVLFVFFLSPSRFSFLYFCHTRLRVVVWVRCKALWEPRLHFADTQACFFMPRPIKMALSGSYLQRLAAAVQED